MKSEEPIPFSREALETLTEHVKQIALQTGAFLSQAPATSISQKEGHANFVTDMDIKVQERLVEALTPLLPGASFLLEEGDEAPALSDFLWIIDPIDGTQNFICRNGLSAISIGLYYKKRGLLGVVCNPFMGDLFWAATGQGAYLNGTPIHPSERPLEAAILCAGTSLYYPELLGRTTRIFTALLPACADLRRLGSAALEICYTACGRCDGFVELRLCPWDFAAAAVILREAGGRLASIEYKEPDCTKKTGLVAGGKVLFDRLWEVIRGTEEA